MTRRKHTHAHAPPTAYCFLHDRYMNDIYVHRKRCLMRGRPICKHFQWLMDKPKEKGECTNDAVTSGTP